MSFDFIKKKGAAMGKQSTSSILKANKYENPQNALDLIAHICTRGSDIDLLPCFEPYNNELEKSIKRIRDFYELEDSAPSPDYIKLKELKDFDFGWILSDALQTDCITSLNIAVAGGYSAGKSSLLNKFMGEGSLLPTGIEPVSVVNTRLSFGSNTKNLIIRGVNLQNKTMALNKDVLACIQHSSKSKVYIASQLKELLISVPAKSNYLNNVTFIDTPGYDNSKNKNLENSVRDRDTAAKAVENAQAIFWCIDIERGTIPNEDITMLKDTVRDSGKDIVIIFTKADKKAPEEVKNILRKAKTIVDTQMSSLNIFNLIAYSADEDRTFSRGGMTLEKIITSLANKHVYKDLYEDCAAEWVSYYFENQLKYLDEEITRYKEERETYIEKRDEALKYQRELTQDNPYEEDRAWIDDFVTNYDKLVKSFDFFVDLYDKSFEGWKYSLEREFKWSEKSGVFSDTSSLKRMLSNSVDNFNQVIKTDNPNAGFTYWTEKDLKESLLNLMPDKEDIPWADPDKWQKRYEENKDLATMRSKWIKEAEELKTQLRSDMQTVLQVIKQCLDEARRKNDQFLSRLASIKESEVNYDVFACISDDNYAGFLDCVSKGFDTTMTNQSGYTPLTWTAHCGNNLIMKYLLAHKDKIDLSYKDKNGHNALETAAICRYRDICELLLEADKTLLGQSQPLEKLAEENTFVAWAKTLS